MKINKEEKGDCNQYGNHDIAFERVCTKPDVLENWKRKAAHVSTLVVLFGSIVIAVVTVVRTNGIVSVCKI